MSLEPVSPSGAPGRFTKSPPSPASIIGGVPGTILALATALGGLLTTYQTHQASEATSKASYEALKTAVERNTEAIAAQARAQSELRLWVQELSERLERRQANTEKVLTRKVSKAPTALPSVGPVPPAPPSPPAPSPSPLPSFEGLKLDR